MYTKKTLFIFLILILLPITQAWGSDTTITGTMSCYMPPMLEYADKTATSIKDIQPPSPSGSSGNYVVQKDELLQEENAGSIKTDTMLQKEEKTSSEKVILYTIYAK
jgi:hypothetical protein